MDRSRAGEHRYRKEHHQPAVENAGRTHDARTLKDRIPLCTLPERLLSAEYILLDSTELRLYLLARRIMDVSTGKER
jgi:hypothetical protein